MDQERAAKLLREERERLVALLEHQATDGAVEREGALEQGDMADSAEPFTSEEESEAVSVSLRERLDTVTRAQQRLRDGTYGFSVLSGAAIPDERLEADPAAELTVDEAQNA
jgi:DnaK suppressor protein